MAAPKMWGFTRGQDIPDEILVSWADGDLTAQVAQEVDETLLMDREQRRKVAAYARAAADSIGEEITEWHGKRPGERREATKWPSGRSLAGMVFAAVVALAVIAWMVKFL